MTTGREHILDEIWAGDKLGRRELAQQVEDYVLARFEQPAPGSGSFTLAVEGSYGLGKSYFLERLRKQLALSQPVAFVNAWTDDTSNDPLTSMFLAIEEAIAEKVQTQDEATKLKTSKKVKDISKIAAKVMARAAGSWLLSQKGLDELEGAFEAGVDDLFGLKPDSAVASPLVSRRKLIDDFKSRLSNLLDTLESDGLFQRPLIVIIDELDRCRPTYAVHLLEEAKHFFDDTGTVFIYGINRTALSATVRSLYGDMFPADHYLMRFFRRQIALPPATLEHFIQEQLDRNVHLIEKLRFPDLNGNPSPAGAAPWLADFFEANNVRARDAEYILEQLFSFAAMWEHHTFIHLPYLAYLAVDKYRQMRNDQQAATDPPPVCAATDLSEVSKLLVIRYRQAQGMSAQSLEFERARENQDMPVWRWVGLEINETMRSANDRDTSYISEYSHRLEAVGKFLIPPPEIEIADGIS